jgi:SAM-dependent methyltransferase
VGLTRGYGLLEPLLARLRARQADSLISESLRRGRVLDIGCGQVPFFLLHTEFAEKIGVERSPVATYDGVALVATDVERINCLPFADSSFDVVTMLAVVEHLSPEGLIELLVEIRRVLKPRGRLVITTPAHWVDPILAVMSKLRLVSPTEIDEHQKTYSPKGLRQLLTGVGFSEAAVDAGLFEFGMNCWATATAG